MGVVKTVVAADAQRHLPHSNVASDANGLFASRTNMISQCSSSPPLLVTSIGCSAGPRQRLAGFDNVHAVRGLLAQLTLQHEKQA